MTIDAEVRAVLAAQARITASGPILLQIAAALAANIKKEKELMSQITDWAATEQADLTTISTTLDAVVTGVAALDALIVGFQNSPGTLSATDQAALDAIVAASAALVTKSAAISTVAPGTPPPPPPPLGSAHR
jgi:hypothetical protein